jgi:hypothetical protein
MHIYELTADDYPAQFWIWSDEPGDTYGWLATPCRGGGWRFEQCAADRRPHSRDIVNYRHLPGLLAAFIWERCGLRPRAEWVPAPVVRWVREPFAWLPLSAYRGTKATYTAEPPTLTLNVTWWEQADYREREDTLRRLPGDPLGPVGGGRWVARFIWRQPPKRYRAPAPPEAASA